VKTQIIQLEAHDDVISTRDKMGWGKTRRILLVWPNRGRVLSRLLDLQLLLRQAQTTGNLLALVTRDWEVRQNARQLGIAVFDSPQQAQEAHWRNPRRQRFLNPPSHRNNLVRKPTSGEEQTPEVFSLRDARPQAAVLTLHPAVRLVFFTIGVLSFLSIAAILIPSAEIVLAPKTQWQEITIDVIASESADRTYLSGLVPLQNVNIIVEGQEDIETSGSISIPAQTGHGEVLFTNLTDQEITIPAGTIVSTPGSEVRFSTDRIGTVPAGAGKTITLSITALQPGSGSRLAANRITAIEGLLGVNLTVTNPSPTIDGSNQSGPAPNETDRNMLSTQLESSLQESAADEIRGLLQIDDLLLNPVPTLVQTVSKVFNPEDIQPASTLTLDMQLEYQSQIVSGEDLEELASAILNASLPLGYSPIPDTLEFEPITAPSAGENSTYKFKISARQQLQAQPNEVQATRLTLGLTPVKASERLSSDLPLASPPEIFLKPSWWPRLPIIPFRINVMTTQPTP